MEARAETAAAGGAAVVFVEGNVTGNGPRLAAACRRLGLRPVLVSGDLAQYDWLDAERVVGVTADTTDPKAVAGAVREVMAEWDVRAVTTCADVFTVVTARAAAEVGQGLDRVDADAVARCRDKAAQRRRLAEAGLPQPRVRVAETADDAVTAAGELGFPVVLKPADGTASIATRICRDAAEARRAAKQILAWRVNHRGLRTLGRALVESLVTGPEFSVETIGPVALGVVGKHLGEPPTCVEVGHDLPATGLAAADEAALRRAACQATAALGLTTGPAHVELRLTPSGPVVIEVNCRMAGGHIPDLLRHAFGLDLYELVVREAAGLPFDVEPPAGVARRAAASIRFLTPPAGVADGARVAAWEGVEAARKAEGVVEVEVGRAPGAELVRRGDFRDRIAHVMTTAETSGEAAALADAALHTLRVVTEPPGPATPPATPQATPGASASGTTAGGPSVAAAGPEGLPS